MGHLFSNCILCIFLVLNIFEYIVFLITLLTSWQPKFTHLSHFYSLQNIFVALQHIFFGKSTSLHKIWYVAIHAGVPLKLKHYFSEAYEK